MAEEKILVSVRVRPLNEKERTRNDRCDWECINNTTIVCKYNNNLPDKSSYSFDKVFGFECPTKQVYDDGAKEVALRVLDGINSSIFAYGQTSSGKTYTMSGITAFAMEDIFAYIEKHKQERKFTLKFSAMEIYNEAVKDLLCEYSNNTPLRLLDDPERGTVVEKLKEETLVDKNHLDELLSMCETQRKIGETSLNETSSRSHQILRLTIESSSREFSPESSATLAASVCFVDLAGSERASQTLSAGSRLKEGCHINRSLLTLGTCIRKLSKGKSGHIPYRDSKLTRILQNSLGGNARTAIICTMSPARSHLEQSRNTLLFATCAKEVTTNAQVNLVVSEKALVKQLQRELARMETELKNLGPASSSSSEFYALLKEKEEYIAKMEEQVQELKWQRDMAQSRVENLLKSTAEERSTDSSSMYNRRRSYDSTDLDEPRMLNNLGKSSNFYSLDEDGFLLDDTTPQFPEHDMSDKWEEMAQSIRKEPEDACKEVRCVEENSGKEVKIQDSLDNIVDKKVMSLDNYISPVPDENQEAMESKKDDADDSLLSLGDKLGELTVNKSEKEVQEAEQYVEKQRESSKEDDMEHNLSKDQYESFIADEKAENEVMELEKDDADSSLKATDIESSLSDKIEAENELTTNQLEEEVKETEQASKKEDKEQNLSMDHSCLDYKQNNESLIADEKAENEAMESEQEGDMELSLDAELEVEDELTLNKLQSQETENSVEKEKSKKEDKEQNMSTDKDDDDAYEALKKKVKEMQKTIEYFISMQSAEQKQSPSFNTIDDSMSPGSLLKMRRSRSCRDNLLFNKAAASGHLIFENSNTSFSSDNTVSIDAQSTKDSDIESGGSSFHEFMTRLKEMANQDHKETETKQENKEEESKATFERQQSQIIELWEVCNVPLVHRTYFYSLFKGGDPSDFVYMEVELRRLSFLRDSPEMSKKQTARALTREREWLAKQIPKKFGRKEKEEVFKKWGVEVSSKQRSLRVTHKLWNNTKEKEQWEESASLVATLVGFVDSKLTPKEMFGLSFSPTTTTFSNNVKSSGWRLGNSFSRISLNGG